ncbi:MAG: peptidoglycan-binding protein [Clostridia bacterium]|nr:peptidoglycan-binding protein [Clostridia bacterium]
MRTLFFRRAAALLLAAVCCLSALPAIAESYPMSAYTTTNLKLRQQPSDTGTVLLTIPSGDMALINGESGNYYIVTYEGTQGFALKQYFRLVDGSVNLPAVTPAPEESAAGYQVLYSGSKGDAVTALQMALKELGFYSGKADGEFGSGTRSAVVSFQAKNGLTQSGTADAATQKLLFEGKPKNSSGKATQVKTVSMLPGATIQSGSTGPAVTKLQLRLIELGFLTGKADGTAGSATVSAIKAFQKKNNLSQTGKADEVTQALLYSSQAVSNAKTTKSAPTPTPIPTANPNSGEATFPFSTYTTDSVNLRKTASTTGTRITTVPKGSEITVLAISGDFLKVTYKGTTGYIVSEYAYVPPQYAPGKALKTDADAQKNYPYLQSGDTGKDVSVLQDALRELGIYTQTTNGTYDAATVSAVKAFQKANSIRQDGIAAPEVLKLIFEGKPLNAKGKKTTVMTLPNRTVSELRSGHKGEQVTDLQQRLKKLGLYTAQITGTYDSATVNAVKKFQEAHKLTQDGVAGEKTLRLLYLLTDSSAASAATSTPIPAATELTANNVIVLRSGTKGTEVTRLQNRLKELGFYTGASDGVYGDAVIAAVKAFQRSSGLTQDGVAGLSTQQALYSDFAVSIATPAPTETPIPGTPTPVVISTGAPSLQTLKTGSKGDLVKALQTKLKEFGYYSGGIDGDYGGSTAAAVKEFQRRNGLTADGVAGEKTLSKLYTSGAAVAASTAKPTAAPAASGSAAIDTTRTLKSGDKGEDVRAMQARLVELGYLTSADSIYGIATYNAVVAFQKKNGLTADGVAGTMTLNRLNSANAITASGTLLINGSTSAQQAASNTSSSSSSAFTPPSASKVQYANWYTTVRAIAKKMPDVVIYDPDSGLYFNLHMFSFGKHADSETPTAADTAILNKIVGVNNWTPKYVWVCFPDGQVYIGSIHSHGHEVDHTPNNDLEGHICLHFPRVMSEAEATGPYAVSHQNEINWGWELTQAMAK